MDYRIVHHKLKFIKEAKTSRNVFTERLVRYVIFSEDGTTGIGEASPLQFLSIDDVDDYDAVLTSACQTVCENPTAFKDYLHDSQLQNFPSIKFGLETALNDLHHGGNRKIFESSFYDGQPIPINGLVWMADLDKMYAEAITKINAGFKCLKFKVGQHDFDAECRLLERIRSTFNAFKLEIRLDANGAFLPDEAVKQLQELSRFDIHCIEQPIKPKQWDDMARICSDSKIDIALDEELIGVDVFADGTRLLHHIAPQYVILKPNLIGGFAVCDEWVALCRKHNVGWWATSALESNIGLNAIAQWVSQYENVMPQGLGTGSLYSNNIKSPMQVKNQELVYSASPWVLDLFQ